MISDRKRILIFSDWYLPGYKAGGPIQSCKNIVQCLSDECEFYIYTSDRDFGENDGYPGIQTDTWISASKNVNIFYSSPKANNLSELKKIIRNVNPHTIYLNSMFSVRFTILPLLVLKSTGFDGRIILAPRGMLHKGAMSLKPLKKKIFLRLLSISGIAKRIYFHATDRQEVIDIQRYFRVNKGVSQIDNIPNIDPDPWQKRSKLPGVIKCVYISRIHPKKNLHSLLAVLNNIDAGCVIDFDVYGTYDNEEYLDQCKEITRSFNSNITVEFKGPLSHNILFPTLQQYHLFILPTLGENFGHAIFEALSSGCPVLISDQTPWADVQKHNAGWAFPLENMAEFTGAITKVCQMNNDEFNMMSLSAKKFSQQFSLSGNYFNDYKKLFTI